MNRWTGTRAPESRTGQELFHVSRTGALMRVVIVQNWLEELKRLVPVD